MRRRLLWIWVAVCIGWAGLIGWAYALNPRGGSIAPPDRSVLTHYVLVGAAPLMLLLGCLGLSWAGRGFRQPRKR
jgi:hypothetical protein